MRGDTAQILHFCGTKPKRFPWDSHKKWTVVEAAFASQRVVMTRKQECASGGKRNGKKGSGMASIDFQEPAGPRNDTLGLSLFIFHLGVGLYILTGWAFADETMLGIYLVVLPAVVTQWIFNRGSCVINNFESWLRTGQWRSQCNPEEGRFLQMLIYWVVGVRPNNARTNALSYGVMGILWGLGVAHLMLLQAGNSSVL